MSPLRLALALLASALAAGCGTTDDRPATLEVISLEVLAPTCGAVQCHSTTTRLEGLVTTRLELLDLGGGPTGGYALLQVHYRL